MPKPSTPSGPPPEGQGARRRQQARSPKRLLREQVGIVHGPIIGCEYKAVERQVATAGFEPQSEARGFLQPGEIVFPVEARPSRGRWRMRLALGAGREVWVSELSEDGAPLLEMVTAGAALEEGHPPEMRIPDVDGPHVSTTPAARPLPTSPAMRPGLTSSSPPRLRRDSDREDQESVMNEAINQSLALGATGRSAVANFLPLRDFLRQEVHRLCEAVQDAEKQAEEEAEKRQTLEHQLTTSQQTKDLLQSEMSIKVQAAAAEAELEKQRREALQSELQRLQQTEASLRLELRDKIADAEMKADAERQQREAVQLRLAEVQAAESRSREQLGRDVLAAQARADEERNRRVSMEDQIEAVRAEQDKRAVKLRDAVAYAESQLMRERNSREDLEQQLSDQQRQEAEQRSAALAAVAKAESAAAAERAGRERLQQSLERAQVENEEHAAELRAQISRAEQDADAERRDRQAKDRELQTLKSTHAATLESLRAKLAEAEKLAEGEKKLRQSIEMSIADARNIGLSDVADMRNKLEQAKQDIDKERQQRQSAEANLERVTAEEKERAANLSQMLQVLSNEVRAARAEVETLRSAGGSNKQQQLQTNPAAMASLETWMDHTGVQAERVETDSGTTADQTQSQSNDQNDPARVLSQLQESHETLKRTQQDAETLKQRLVEALQENQQKSEKLKEERAKRKELLEQMESSRESHPESQPAAGLDDSHDSTAAVDATVTAMLAAAEETAMAHHEQLTDEIATHIADHAAQQAVSEEKLLQRLQISGDALAQAVKECTVANDSAKLMQIRLSALTRERDDALQEVIECKRVIETWKAKERNLLAREQQVRLHQGQQKQQGQGTHQHCVVDDSVRDLEQERSKWQHLCQECEAEIKVLRQQLQESQNSVELLATERDELTAQIEIRVEAVEADKFADTDFSPAKSRELRREVKNLREVASTRKQELDQRVGELARLEAEREKYEANLAEKTDEIGNLKALHAEEVRTLNDQHMAEHDKYIQKEREQEERHARSLAEAEARAQAWREERDRVSEGRAEERTKAEEILKHATEKHNAAASMSETLVAELEHWLTLSQQPALRTAVVSSHASRSPGRDQLSGFVTTGTLSPGPSTVSNSDDAQDDEISVGWGNDGEGRGQSLVPASPVESAPSVYGGWQSETPTPAIPEVDDEEEEEAEEEEDETLAELYRLVRPVSQFISSKRTIHFLACPWISSIDLIVSSLACAF